MKIYYEPPIAFEVKIWEMQENYRFRDQVSNYFGESAGKIYQVLSELKNDMFEKKNVTDVTISRLTGLDEAEVQSIMKNIMFRISLSTKGKIKNKRIETEFRLIESIEEKKTDSGWVVFYHLSRDFPNTKEHFLGILHRHAEMYQAFEKGMKNHD